MGRGQERGPKGEPKKVNEDQGGELAGVTCQSAFLLPLPQRGLLLLTPPILFCSKELSQEPQAFFL